MIILSLTTDKVSLITSSTANIDVVAAYIDRNQSTGVVGLADRQLTTISTATTTDIVAVPGATTTRNVKRMTIRNRHATASNDVTVQINANGTLYELHKVTLLAGECLQYIEDFGFVKLVDTTRLDRNFICGTNSVHATAATFADITDLQCPMKNGVTYGFLACLIHGNNASTTGSQFGVNVTGAAYNFLRVGTIDTVTPSVTASAHSAGVTTANDTAITAQTTGSTSARLAIIAGYIQPSADVTFSMRATSEVTVASGLTVFAGSWLRVFRHTG